MNSSAEGATIKNSFAIPLFLMTFVIGCGSDDSMPVPAGGPSSVEIVADQANDRKIGLDFRRYLVRNCLTPAQKEWALGKYPGPSGSFALYRKQIRGLIALCGGIASIEVDNSRVTARSDLESGAGRQAAEAAFCNLIQGSDVADFIDGHQLQDTAGRTIKVCIARNE